VLVELRSPDQRVIVETAGGSGFGDPRRRAVEAVERDLREGYVTMPEGTG
jgi:N-methylhydantoinase B/oxoprolinase/acetone carboxylase alpha subunit